MAALIAPFTGVALRYAAVAAGAFLLARTLPKSVPDARAEAAMDDLADGVALSGDDGAARATARWRKSLRLGGAGLRLDAAMLARLKVNRI